MKYAGMPMGMWGLQEKMGWLDLDPATIRHILITHQDTYGSVSSV